MSRSLDDSAADRQDDPEEQEEPEDPRLSALIEALANGDAIDWQEAESSAGSAEEKERVRALAAISEVATFHRTWLAEGGIFGNLDEDEEADEEIPTHWGELEIIERVGRGSFGDVYKAREPRLDRIVALKLIRASARTSEREAETLREGRLLAKVRHPNVATVHGAAGADGRVGFWMEFLEGKNLAEILEEEGRFDPRVAARIGIDLCRALAAVHAQGIVHRDVKAQNVVWENAGRIVHRDVKAQNVVREDAGRIVLTDFGVGRDAAVLETEEPSLSGTPLYLAPELFEGKPPSPASDVYALGVLLFYLVTGEFPVTGASFDELRSAHRERKRRWLKELRKELPGTFVAAVEKALDREPEKRLDEAGMENELLKFTVEKIERKKRIRLWLFACSILGMSIVTAGLLIYGAQEKKAAIEALRKADKYADAGKMQEALPFLEDALRRYPKLPGIYWRLMSVRSADGDYDGAFEADAASEPLCMKSETRDCHLVRAWSALLKLNYKVAIDDLNRAKAIKSDNEIKKQVILAQVNLGHPEFVTRDAGDLKEAEGITEASLLASTLSAANHYSEALDALPALRAKFPGDSNVDWVAGQVLIASGDVSGAEELFKNMAERPGDSGDSSEGHLLWAQALMFQTNFKDAQSLLVGSGNLNKQENFSRNDAVRSILLARCFILTGDRQEAFRFLRLVGAQRLMPANLKVFRNAAIVSFEAGNIALGARFAGIVRGLAQRYPSDLSNSFDYQLQGELAWREGRLDDAVTLIQRAIDLRDDPQNMLSMAQVQIEANRCDLAANFLDGVIRKKGLILGDFFTPWTIWNDAVALKAKCLKQ